MLRIPGGSGHLILLDTNIHEGIRLHQEVLTYAGVKPDWYADTSYTSGAERCLSYGTVFFRGGNEKERKSLGCE